MMELIVKNWTYESGRKPTYLRSFTFDKLDFECRNDDLVKNGFIVTLTFDNKENGNKCVLEVSANWQTWEGAISLRRFEQAVQGWLDAELEVDLSNNRPIVIKPAIEGLYLAGQGWSHSAKVTKCEMIGYFGEAEIPYDR